MSEPQRWRAIEASDKLLSLRKKKPRGGDLWTEPDRRHEDYAVNDSRSHGAIGDKSAADLLASVTTCLSVLDGSEPVASPRGGGDPLGGPATRTAERSAFTCYIHQDRSENGKQVEAVAETCGQDGRDCLSTVHISPRKADVRVKPAKMGVVLHHGGRLMRLRGLASGGGAMDEPRGVVGGFSAASRRRLMQLLATVDEGATGADRFLVTLTYPRFWPGCAREWKRHLDSFLKRLRRVGGFESCVWKLEPQKRGAPHFHLLVFMDGELAPGWVGQAWYDIVDSGNLKHLAVSSHPDSCQRIQSWNGVMSYTAKYIAKAAAMRFPADIQAIWSKAGRWWGKCGVLRINPLEEDLTPGQFFAARRLLRRFVSRQAGHRVRSWGRSGMAAFVRFETQGAVLLWVKSLP